MNITEKEFTQESIEKAGSVYQVDKKGKETGYRPGVLRFEVPELWTWDEEDLKEFSFWVAEQLKHYGPTQMYKSDHGDQSEDKRGGRYERIDGVVRINPKWRPGQMTEEQFAKALAQAENFLGQRLTDEEVRAKREAAGLPAVPPKG